MNEALEKEPVLSEDVLLSVSVGSKTPPRHVRSGFRVYSRRLSLVWRSINT